MALAGDGAGRNPDEIVSFPEWREALGGAAALSAGVRQAYMKSILGLLRACKSTGRPLSAGFIRWYLEQGSLSAAERQARRAAFAWLFKAARGRGRTEPAERAFQPPDDAVPAAGDVLHLRSAF